MTVQFLNKKITEIENLKAKALANYNALCGAEQAYKEMLAELEKAKTEEAKK